MPRHANIEKISSLSAKEALDLGWVMHTKLLNNHGITVDPVILMTALMESAMEWKAQSCN